MLVRPPIPILTGPPPRKARRNGCQRSSRGVYLRGFHHRLPNIDVFHDGQVSASRVDIGAMRGSVKSMPMRGSRYSSFESYIVLLSRAGHAMSHDCERCRGVSSLHGCGGQTEKRYRYNHNCYEIQEVGLHSQSLSARVHCLAISSCSSVLQTSTLRSSLLFPTSTTTPLASLTFAFAS